MTRLLDILKWKSLVVILILGCLGYVYYENAILNNQELLKVLREVQKYGTAGLAWGWTAHDEGK